MITHIHIEHFTIVDQLDIEFQTGLSALTGETGAGKSIWIDAVSLALGERADNNFIKVGHDRCSITLSFNLDDNPLAKNWLQEHALDAEQECIIRRVLSRSSSSRATINGTPVPLTQIRQLAPLLINIHSQNQHQQLLRREGQRQQLDAYAGNAVFLKDIEAIYDQWSQAKKQEERYRTQLSLRDAELDLLQYQANELATLNITSNEWQELSRQHLQLHNSKQLMTELNDALEMTCDDEQHSALSLSQRALTQINAIAQHDPILANAGELLNNAVIHLQEAAGELHAFRNQLDLSPERLQEIENRLANIHDVARKHHCHPSDLAEVEQSLKLKINELTELDDRIEQLIVTQQNLEKQYQVVAKKLTARRKKAIVELNKIISAHIQQLGIKGGEFAITLTPIDKPMSVSGNEQVQFMICTNPGAPLQALNKTASGGELSRVCLALLVATANKEGTPTLIFDEVDVGIGGKTAAVVGRLLHQLGSSKQVLCITHLAQVASYCDHHYQVSKSSSKASTTSHVKQLNSEQRVQEIARMLGGEKITEQTLRHAQELIETAG